MSSSKSTANSKNGKPNLRKLEAERNAAHKRQQKEFAALLKPLKATGIYLPKSSKMTKYRKARVRKAYKEFHDQLGPSQFLFAKVPRTAKKKGILSKAAKVTDVFKPTRTGVFVAKDGYQKAEVKINKKGEASVIRSGKSKVGSTVIRRTKSALPIATLDEMDAERDKIRRAAEKLGPLKEGEVYIYVIRDNSGENYGRHAYERIDQLLEKLDHYDKGRAREAGKRGLAWLTLARSIEIHKISYEDFAESDTRQDRSARAYYRKRGGRRLKGFFAKRGRNNAKGKKGT